MQFLKVDTLGEAREKLLNAVQERFVKTEKMNLIDTNSNTFTTITRRIIQMLP